MRNLTVSESPSANPLMNDAADTPGSATPSTPYATFEEAALEVDVDSRTDTFLTRCGYCRWRPDFLQCANKPNILAFLMACYSLVLGFMVNGVHNVNVSTIERRYDLPSTKVAFISSTYDVSAALLAVIIGYYGSGKRKARMLALSIFISGIGSWLYACPNYFAGPYTLGMAQDKICVSSVNSSCSDILESSGSHYLYVFIIAHLLHGIGGTTLFTVGISLIDDSVDAGKTPLFLGIIYGTNILGSGIGYIVGGQFLRLYIDFDKIEDIQLTPKDVRWLGAWWVGPTLAGFLQFLIALPISLYGAELPQARAIRLSRVNQAHEGHVELSSTVKKWKFLSDTAIVMRNPCFMFITLAMTSEGMFLSGAAAFMAKYIENQYSIPASKAATVAGSALGPAAIVGLILGGYVAKKFNFTIKQAIKWLICTTTVSAMSMSVLWIKCKPTEIIGVNLPYPGQTDLSAPIKLTAPCNSLCHCDTDAFDPVCGNGTGIYFSGCHAGCSTHKEDEFLNCKCVGDPSAPISFNQSTFNHDTVLTSVGCREPCDLLYLFIVLLFLAMCVSFLPIAPGDSIQLRCVLEEHKVFAQGIKTLFARMLGSFVGAILMGKLLDLTCEIWRESCGQNLSCWIYDHNSLVLSVFFYGVFLKCVGLIFCCLAHHFYQSPHTPQTVVIVKSATTNPLHFLWRCPIAFAVGPTTVERSSLV